MFVSPKSIRLAFLLCAVVSAAISQQPTAPADLRSPSAVTPTQTPVAAPLPAPAAPKGPERVPNYVLGPDDQIIIRAFKLEEISDRPIQVAGDGYINLAFVGRVKAAGLSVSELEAELTKRLKNYVLDPQVTVMVSDYRSQPVSVVGAVNTPGVIQLRGRRSLVEVIAQAGGLKVDAANTVTITRELSQGRIPIPDAKDDPTGRFSVAHLNLHNVMEAQDPQNNILIEANDVVMIPKAQLLYVVGEVQRPGGYVLSDRDSLSVLQAVALAGGLTHAASPKKARILHQEPDHTMRTQSDTNVYAILNGKAPDVSLHADDVLFVPSSLPKTAGGKALETALNMAGIAVWRF